VRVGRSLVVLTNLNRTTVGVTTCIVTSHTTTTTTTTTPQQTPPAPRPANQRAITSGFGHR